MTIYRNLWVVCGHTYVFIFSDRSFTVEIEEFTLIENRTTKQCLNRIGHCQTKIE